MADLKEGSIVQCAFCKKEVAVKYTAEYEGTEVYNLACFHRNAFCSNCGKLAKDISETISQVVKHCADCDPAIEED